MTARQWPQWEFFLDPGEVASERLVPQGTWTIEITVLVADSQLLFAETLAISLGMKPDIRVFDEYPATAREAIEATRRLQPDVALLDYWLLEGGPAAAEAIRFLSPPTKVLLLSWELSPDYISNSVSSGAVGFLPKSISVNEVAEAVRRAEAGQSFVYQDKLTRMFARLQRQYEETARLAERFRELTPRQLQVLGMLGAGFPIEEVGKRLGISRGTVMLHINKILTRTGARSQSEVVALARQAGLIGPAPTSQPPPNTFPPEGAVGNDL